VPVVTARLPSTISLIRRGGARNARASAVWIKSSRRRDSSSRISPGVGLGSQSGSGIIDHAVSARTNAGRKPPPRRHHGNGREIGPMQPEGAGIRRLAAATC